MKIAVVVRHRVVRVERAHRVRVVRGVQEMPDVGNGVIGFDHIRSQVRDLVMAFLAKYELRRMFSAKRVPKLGALERSIYLRRAGFAVKF